MNSNRSALDVLAREGISITEEGLLNATQKTRSNRNEAATAPEAPSCDLAALESAPWSILELNGGRDNSGATTQTAPAGESRSGEPTRRILSVLRIILLFPFKALRELYWLIDPDAKVRSQGLQVVGSVVKTRTSSSVVTDEFGNEETVYTHHVTYRFDANGGTHSGEKKVGSLRNLAKGSPITVYYLPDTYPPNSAIDWEPRAVARGA